LYTENTERNRSESSEATEHGGLGEYTRVVEWRTITLDRGDVGVRIDRVLLRHLRDQKGVSRNRIQKWIDDGGVLINGAAPARSSWRVQAGDQLRVRVSAIPLRTKPKPEAGPIEVLYEDEDLLAVNKPAGIVVHPSFRNTTGTLINRLLAQAQSWPPGCSPALVGRLDKLTSGLVLVTKRSAVHAQLQRAMAANRVDKDYFAIVHGKPPVKGTISLALDRDPWDRRRITVTDRGGQPSVTKYERLATVPGYSTVRCRLITGRTHQIRVHLAARGWPIVGDATYGKPGPIPRQALHAWKMSLRHPRTGQPLSLEAPLPDDMRALARELGLLKA
jgi:23S rRNA pseudouridine1911/1915/1917 synthase